MKYIDTNGELASTLFARSHTFTGDAPLEMTLTWTQTWGQGVPRADGTRCPPLSHIDLLKG